MAAEILHPSSDEQELYYFGLPSRPKLIARSSTTPWEPKMDRTDPLWPSLRTKSLTPPGRHHLIPLWNDINGDLRKDIIEALAGTEWHTIDLLRLGYDSPNGEEPDGPQPITLLVSIEPTKVAWEEAHRVVMRCKAILEEHGISDVHCEMRESKFHRAADSPQLRASSGLGLTRPATDADTYTSECIGVPIGSSGGEDTLGTKGLYLRSSHETAVGKSSTVFALTCRHVVFDREKDDGNVYAFDGSQPQVTMVQPDKVKILDTITTATTYVDAAEETLAKQNPGSEYNALLEDLRRQYQRDLDRLESFQAAEARIIGHVVFAPPYQLRSPGFPHNPSRTNSHHSDWALIELYQSKYETPLANIANEVHVGHQWGTQLEQAYVTAPAFRGHEMMSHTTIRLRDTIPTGEMLSPPLLNREGDPAILVAKAGGSSGLTLGFATMCKSIRREVFDGENVYTEEWCIVGVRKNKEAERAPFSMSGDSGSCIFDPKGRIGGMLTGGVGNEGAWDITYATPVRWILDELREYGFDVSLA